MHSKTNFNVFLPPNDLRHLIKCFWTLEGTIYDYNQRSYADNFCELIFRISGDFFEQRNVNFERDKLPQSSFHFQRSHYTNYIGDGKMKLIGVYLYPYTIPLIERIDGKEIYGLNLSIDDLYGHLGKLIEEQIMECSDESEAFSIICHFIRSRLKNSQIDPFLLKMTTFFDKGTFTSTSLLADQFNMSKRNLIRKFDCYIGTSPSKAIRVNRFKKTIEGNLHENKSLLQIGLENGYYDHSHFIKDVKSFSGYLPKDFFKQRPEDLEWIV